MARATAKRATASARAAAAKEVGAILDSRLFRALCEPRRVDILTFLIANGRADVGTVAEHVPQDRSVVARHLQALEEVGVLRSEKVSRHRYYEVDAVRFVERMRGILCCVEDLIPTCCPEQLEER